MSGLLQALLAKLDRGDALDSKWPDAKGEYWALCPFHEDHHATNFSVSERGFKCFACGAKGSLRQLGQHLVVDLSQDRPGLTLKEYADAKCLPLGFLKTLGVTEARERRGSGYASVLRMPYKDEKGNTLRVRRRLALHKAKQGRDMRFRWARGQGLYLYGLWRLPDVRKVGWALLVEGESDCHTAWLHDIPALGVPGAEAWKREWTQHLDGLDVYVWQEPDIGGETFVSSLQRDLPTAKVLAPPKGIKDLSEAHIQERDVVALVEGLKAEARPIAEAKTLAQTAKTLSELAPWVRERLGKRASRETKVQVAETIAGWLLAHKRLLVDTGQDQGKGGRPYLVADDGALWPLERDAVTTRRTLYDAGLNATEPTYRFVQEALTMEAYKHGQQVTLSRWQEARGDALYVSCGPHHLVRARDSSLEKLPNGTDEVWFAGDLTYPEWEPSEPVHPLTLHAFNPCLEVPDGVPDYTKEVQASLLATWMAALPSGLRPLPGLIPVGQAGGGKTMLGAAVLRTFYGPGARHTTLSDDKRDFQALVTRRPVVCLDNVDDRKVPSWFADEFSATVTGAQSQRRALYTDDELLERPRDGAIIVTTRTASFVRPDVASRTLPILTGEFEDSDRVADADLLAQVDAHRNGILSWCTQMAARLLAERHKAPPGLPLRFVDYARMVWAYMRTQGRQEYAAGALLALRQAQSLTVGEADPLVEALLLHCDDIADGGHWRGSASQLVRALADAGADLPYLGGAKGIARRLRELKGTLKLMGMQLHEYRGPSEANRRVTFTLSMSQTSQTQQTGKVAY